MDGVTSLVNSQAGYFHIIKDFLKVVYNSYTAWLFTVVSLLHIRFQRFKLQSVQYNRAEWNGASAWPGHGYNMDHRARRNGYACNFACHVFFFCSFFVLFCFCFGLISVLFYVLLFIFVFFSFIYSFWTQLFEFNNECDTNPNHFLVSHEQKEDN